MYQLFNQISSTFIGPVQELAYGFEQFPLIFAFFLGIVGAVAPCQLTSNVSAISIYSNKLLVDNVPWLDVFLFILGKLVVFSILWIVIWLLGREVYGTLSQLLPILRKSIGPLLIVIGLFMVALFHWKKTFRTFNLLETLLRDSCIV